MISHLETGQPFLGSTILYMSSIWQGNFNYMYKIWNLWFHSAGSNNALPWGFRDGLKKSVTTVLRWVHPKLGSEKTYSVLYLYKFRFYSQCQKSFNSTSKHIHFFLRKKKHLENEFVLVKCDQPTSYLMYKEFWLIINQVQFIFCFLFRIMLKTYSSCILLISCN